MHYTAKQSASLLAQLCQMAPDSSKNTLQLWLKARRITVNGKLVYKPHMLVEKGAQIKLSNKPPKRLGNQLRILHEDAHMIAIHKPAGLLSVATLREKEHTAHAILKKYKPSRVYPVHRLDRDTQGVMVFATSLQALHGLKAQFADHSIYREYRARVEGHLLHPKGTLNYPLLEDANYHVRVDPRGKTAITHYEVLSNHANHTELKLILETGKKNQIRVHLAHIGHPVLGDKKYGAQLQGPLKLLAYRLTLVHPITHKTMDWVIDEKII